MNINAALLSARLCQLLGSRSLTVATAESCTGGLIAKFITDIPGAGEVFLGGVAAYHNSVKTRVLSVPEATLAAFGAVSKQTAAAMARGVRALTGADVAVSTTGIAGPGGGSPEKPVGLVYIAVDTAGRTRVWRLRLPEHLSRAAIRHAASAFAIAMVTEAAVEVAGAHEVVPEQPFPACRPSPQ